MTTAISKAWEENLKLNEDDRYETKEELISALCVDSDYDFKIKAKTDDEGAIICKQFGKEGENRCAKCFNCEIIEDKQQDNNINESESTFEQLKQSPIEHIKLNDCFEDALEVSAKNNYNVIHDGKNSIKYSDIPKLIKWYQDVYTYATELKNKVEYTDWKTARNHMEQEGKCKLADIEYFIKDNTLYWEFKSEPTITTLSLAMLDSNKWILI